MVAPPTVPVTRAVHICDGQVGLHGLGRRGDSRQDGAGWGGAAQGGRCGRPAGQAPSSACSAQRWKKKLRGREVM